MKVTAADVEEAEQIGEELYQLSRRIEKVLKKIRPGSVKELLEERVRSRAEGAAMACDDLVAVLLDASKETT